MNLKRHIIEKLNTILEENGIILAYMFGSFARGKVSPLSDFDIAVLFSAEIPQETFFDRELKVANQIRRKLQVERVDVVNLGTADDPLLRYNAVFLGKLLFEKDQELRFELERKVMREYEDTKHLREAQARILKRHIQEGTFGRVPE